VVLVARVAPAVLAAEWAAPVEWAAP